MAVGVEHKPLLLASRLHFRFSNWTYLKEVSSLKSPSSSDPARLAALLTGRELAAEFPRELAVEDCFDFAFLETVLPLSRACRLRSCILYAEIYDVLFSTVPLAAGTLSGLKFELWVTGVVMDICNST